MNTRTSANFIGWYWRYIREWLIFGIILVGISFSSLFSYLLFHSLAEVFSITITAGTFFIAWNVRRYFDNRYLLFIGISFLFISILEALHMLTYKGMNIFPWNDPTNLPTQIWIATRYMLALSFLTASLTFRNKVRTGLILTGYFIVTGLIILSIFYWQNFPDCYIDGSGLSPFKIISEYVIAGLFGISIIILIKKRSEFDHKILAYLITTLSSMILTEIAFTHYVNVYGIANLIGHILMIISNYLLYKAIIETGLNQPYSLLFRNLKKSEISLEIRANQLAEINTNLLKEKKVREQTQKEIEEYRKHLEDLVNQRTHQLIEINQRLETEINDKAHIENELRALSTRTIESLEEERQTISRELHDETGQSLTVLNLLLANLKRSMAQGKNPDIAQIEEAQEVVKEVMAQIRALSTNLHPSMLDNIGLIPTLVWYVNEFSKRTGIKVNFDYSGGEINLSPKIKLTAYRIIQESLTNITRYAGVDEAFVQIQFTSGQLLIFIEDEGKGFDPSKTTTTASGIRGMRERAKAVGGNLNISSLPGEGTRMEVILPILPETNDAQ
jgi:signal transduction histidine kinase